MMAIQMELGRDCFDWGSTANEATVAVQRQFDVSSESPSDITKRATPFQLRPLDSLELNADSSLYAAGEGACRAVADFGFRGEVVSALREAEARAEKAARFRRRGAS